MEKKRTKWKLHGRGRLAPKSKQDTWLIFFRPVRWSELWLKLAEKRCSSWIVVKEKHCFGWKNKPNKPNLRQANGAKVSRWDYPIANGSTHKKYMWSVLLEIDRWIRENCFYGRTNQIGWWLRIFLLIKWCSTASQAVGDCDEYTKELYIK